jgi:hypothetical protein
MFPILDATLFGRLGRTQTSTQYEMVCRQTHWNLHLTREGPSGASVHSSAKETMRERSTARLSSEALRAALDEECIGLNSVRNLNEHCPLGRLSTCVFGDETIHFSPFALSKPV